MSAANVRGTVPGIGCSAASVGAVRHTLPKLSHVVCIEDGSDAPLLDGSADFESNQRSFDTRYGVYIDRITEDWKLQFRPFFNYNYDRFEREDRTITSSARRDGFTTYAIRSISPHWSVGAYGDLLTSTFSNIDWRYRFMGAVEWSLFPYREANRRQVRQ